VVRFLIDCLPKLIATTLCTLLVVVCGCRQSTEETEKDRSNSDLPETTSATSNTNEKAVVSDEAISEAIPSVKAPIYFSSMLQSSGITFRHTSGNSKEKPFPAANGSGLAAFDLDLDGWLDIYFGCGTHFPIDRTRSSPADEMYRNMQDWRFQNVTALTGISNPDYTAGIEVGDFNSDGLPDLYVTSVGINQLYCNLGDGTFEEIASKAGVDDPRWATSSAFIDFDSDGFLDLYVCNYGKWSFETNKYCGDQARHIRMFCSPTMVEWESDVFYRNLGDGTFEDISVTAGIHKADGRGQGVISGDFNGDRRADLYVANDINPNSLLLNTGTTTFDERGEVSGTAYDYRGQSQAGMGLAQGDIDRNGLLDLFVTNYQNEHNALYENLGNASFLECGLTRIPEGSLPNVGWGTALADFDLDGWLDLIVTNGHTDDNLAELGKEGAYLQKAALWRNTDGYFKLIRDDCGPHFQVPQNGRGLVSGDFDNDGDQDVMIMHQDNAPALLRNDSPHMTTPTIVQIVDRIGNRDGLGASVSMTTESMPYVRMISGGGSYASSSDRRIFLASPTSELHLDLGFLDQSEKLQTSLNTGHSYTILRRADTELSVYELPFFFPPNSETPDNVQ
jgi:hypothetical protein